MLQHQNNQSNTRRQRGTAGLFSLLGGAGVAAFGIGVLARSLGLTALGVACAAAGVAGAQLSKGANRAGNGARNSVGDVPEGAAPHSKASDGASNNNHADQAFSLANADAEQARSACEKPASSVQGSSPQTRQEVSADAPDHAKGKSAAASLEHASQANGEEANEENPSLSAGKNSAEGSSSSRIGASEGASEENEPSEKQGAHEKTGGINSDEFVANGEPRSSSDPDDAESVEGEEQSGLSARENAEAARTNEPESNEAHDTGTAAYIALRQRLLESSDPLAELRLAVADIHERELDADIDPSETEPPAPVETYLARRLDEAGLTKNDLDMPAVRVVSPRRTHLFYLRTNGSMTYAAKLRVLAIEAALNAYAFANRYFKSPSKATLEQVYQLCQGLTSSVCAQIPNITMELPREGQPLSDPDGEWMVREVLGQALETVQTPYRLTATYRANVACGDVAIQVDVTPASVFPGTAWVDDNTGIVPTTSDMRRQEASRYALRMGIMLAACAFHSSQRVRHVWVQGVLDTPNSHACYYHARIDRSAFRWIEMDHIVDPISCLLCLGGTLRHENGILQPIEEGFSLDDQRFCPPRRFEPVALSTRTLDPRYAYALGTSHVSDLAISDTDERQAVADSVVRNLTDSTEHNVRMIFDLAAQTPDASVKSAAQRTATKLIDGTLSDDDALAIHEEFVSGDPLTRATEKGMELLEHKDFKGAASVFEGALAPIDAGKDYQDTSSVAYRAFDSYVDRAIYNRLHLGDSRTVRLVPHAYLEAHMALAISLLAQGDLQGALKHAERGHEIAPVSGWATLNLVTCLVTLNREDDAVKQLDDLLKVAHDPQSIGLAYYQMAHLQWSRGNLLAARACFERIPTSMSQSMPTLGREFSALLSENGGEEATEPLSDEASRKILADHGIPVAPSERIAHYFYEGMAASFDAEVFPVAKNFVEQLGQLSGDDVVMDVIRSVEGEPDR